MTRINKKSDLPSWFDLKKYTPIQSMNDIDFFNQLHCRYHIIKMSEYTQSNEIIEYIQDGVIDAEKHFNYEMMDAFNKDDNKYVGEALSSHGGVEPLSVLSFSAIRKNVEDYRASYDSDDLFLKLFKDTKHVSLLGDNKEEVIMKVDLTMNDDFLIDDFRKLIPKWRSELGVTVCDNSLNFTWPIVRKRVLDYSVIPMIDLKIWESVTDSRISNGVLAVTLFPDGDYDSINIAQTIKPFLEKLLDYSSIEKYRREVFT